MKIHYYESHIKLLSNQLHAIYSLFGWTWSEGVPTPSQIEETIERLVDQVQKEKIDFISSGRITVQKSDHDDITDINIYLDLLSGELEHPTPPRDYKKEEETHE